MKHNLLAHSGFQDLARERGGQNLIIQENNQPDFSFFFWHGGFILIISYIIIAIGTVLCVKYLIAEGKEVFKKK